MRTSAELVALAVEGRPVAHQQAVQGNPILQILIKVGQPPE